MWERWLENRWEINFIMSINNNWAHLELTKSTQSLKVIRTHLFKWGSILTQNYSKIVNKNLHKFMKPSSYIQALESSTFQCIALWVIKKYFKYFAPLEKSWIEMYFSLHAVASDAQEIYFKMRNSLQYLP